MFELPFCTCRDSPDLQLLVMAFEWQMAADASILAGAIIFTLITVVYFVMLWSMRRNFFILLR